MAPKEYKTVRVALGIANLALGVVAVFRNDIWFGIGLFAVGIVWILKGLLDKPV